MKKIYKPLSAVLAFSLIFILYACPIGLDHSLGAPGTEKIDQQLVGTWKITGDQKPEVMSVKISKKDNNSYTIEVLERGELYALETDKLTGWVTTVNDKKFFYVKPDNEEKYYHYCYSFDDKKTLRIHDVSLLDGGVDAVTSTETMRTQVGNSISKEGWGSEQFTYARQ